MSHHVFPVQEMIPVARHLVKSNLEIKNKKELVDGQLVQAGSHLGIYLTELFLSIRSHGTAFYIGYQYNDSGTRSLTVAAHGIDKPEGKKRCGGQESHDGEMMKLSREGLSSV